MNINCQTFTFLTSTCQEFLIRWKWAFCLLSLLWFDNLHLLNICWLRRCISFPIRLKEVYCLYCDLNINWKTFIFLISTCQGGVYIMSNQTKMRPVLHCWTVQKVQLAVCNKTPQQSVKWLLRTFVKPFGNIEFILSIIETKQYPY